MLSSELRNLILSHKKDCALLIGNGINRYANSGCSWNVLLKALAKSYCHSDFDNVPTGISNTEFFDSLELSIIKNTPLFRQEDFKLQKVSLRFPKGVSERVFEEIQRLGQSTTIPKISEVSPALIESYKNALQSFETPDFEIVSTICELGNKSRPAISNSLAKSICRLMQNWVPSSIHKAVALFAKKFELPILTTNYDNLLGNAVNAKFKKLGNEEICEAHPISCCYSTKRKPSVDAFGIWHINGMSKYPTSILIGLTHYMRAIENIRAKILPPNKFNAEIFQGIQWDFKRLSNSWLEIIFRKNLFILGLALETDEVFLRWLLIERAKFYALYPYLQKDGWYITTEQEEISSGKEYFLKSAGFKIIRVPNYSDIYNSISNEVQV